VRSCQRTEARTITRFIDDFDLFGEAQLFGGRTRHRMPTSETAVADIPAAHDSVLTDIYRHVVHLQQQASLLTGHDFGASEFLPLRHYLRHAG